MEETTHPPKKLGFWRIIKSTLAAGFGVQSKSNLSDDFQHGKSIHFIVAGIIFTLIFLLSVIGFVKLVLN